MADVLRLADRESLADLGTFVRRAVRADPDGSARLVTAPSSGGPVLAVWVCPVSGGGGPVVMGLRTFALVAADGSGEADDVVVPLAALVDRCARLARDAASTDLPVPPAAVPGPSWAGVSPPRTGWTEVGDVGLRELREEAHRGITEVAAGAPDVAGAPAVAALRARVWGRAVGEGPAAVPAGAAFVAQALGFLPPADPPLEQTEDVLGGLERLATGAADPRCAVRAAGPWRRLTLPGGHVLARGSAL